MAAVNHRSAWLAGAVTIVLWASAFAAIRAALRSFSVGELSFARLAVASLVLAVAAPMVGLRLPARRDLLRLFGAGATGMAAYQLLLNSGERTVTAGTASMLVNTGPIFVAVLAIGLLGERLTLRGWLGIAVGFLGAVVIALGAAGGVSLSAGALLVLGAAVSQATFFVIQKPLLARYSAFEVTAYAMWFGTLLLIPLAPAVPDAVAGASTQALAAIVFLALGASAVGFFAWAYTIARIPVSRAASALYLVPGVAILVAWLWLGELPSLITVLGGGVALTGVILTNTGRQSASAPVVTPPPLPPATQAEAASTR